jgi:acetyl esterase/lipase
MSTVEVRRSLAYGPREATVGDLYLPSGAKRAPVVVAIHGGAWKMGDRGFYGYWGPWLAARGVAVFAIDYRLVAGRENLHPAAFQDARAGVQFVRREGAALGLDPDRIAVMGDSAGAHLAALVGLAGDLPPFARQGDVSTRAKVIIGVYGVYDFLAQWEHDQIHRPRDNITQNLIGVAPMDDRRAFIDASPLTYATTHANTTAVMLAWGPEDDVVDVASQSGRFLIALKQAGYFCRTVVVPGAGHFWIKDPIDEPRSFPGFFAPRLLRFLEERL